MSDFDYIKIDEAYKRIRSQILRTPLVTSEYINNFLESRISDQSAIEAVNVLAHKYREEGKNITLKHLSFECKQLLLKADPAFSEMIEDAVDDPRYHVAADPSTFK